MRAGNFTRCWWLGVAINVMRGLCARDAYAQPYEVVSTTPVTNGTGSDPSSAPILNPLPWSADVVLVGEIPNAASLTQSIADLLRARGVAPQFIQRRALTERDLLESPTSNSRATVWILVPYPDMVRLLFADPAFQRFLVREIPLLRGLDELGRESVGQVIESSLLALLQGSPGISRADFHATLGQYLAVQSTAAPVAPNVSKRPLVAPGMSPPRSPPTRFATRHRFGASYAVAWSGGDLGVEHGPGIVAGLEFVGPRYSLWVTTAFELHFAQHHRTPEMDLEVRSNAGWLLLGWRKPLSSSASFVAMVGPGLNAARVRPHMNTPQGTAEPDFVHFAPWLRASMGFEWYKSPLALQLLAVSDVSLYRTRYDIEINGSKQPMTEPWWLRPGAALGVIWR